MSRLKRLWWCSMGLATLALLLMQGCLNSQPLAPEAPMASPEAERVQAITPEVVERFQGLQRAYARRDSRAIHSFIQGAIARQMRGEFIRETEPEVHAHQRVTDDLNVRHEGITDQVRLDLAAVRGELAREWQSGTSLSVREGFADLLPASVRNFAHPDANLEALATGAQAFSHSGASPLRGAFVFFNPDFGSNNRACNTCHAALNRFSIGPSLIQARWSLFGPSDPLFRSIDADVVGGSTYNRLRQTGTFNVGITLPPNWSVDGCGSTAVNTQLGPDGRCTPQIPRGSPSVLNTALKEPLLMVDGREPTLQGQAPNAVLTHNQPTATSRQLTMAEAADVAAFQRQLFSSETLRRYANGGPAPVLPPGDNAAEERGRVFFDSATYGARALCAQCHDGPNLNQTNQFNFAPSIDAITGLVNPRLSNNESDLFNPNGLPERVFRWFEPLDGPGAPARTVTRVDMGRAMTTGSACLESVLVCLFNPGGGLGIFIAPSLWDTAENPRFFHNNNATTVAQVFQHYMGFFHRTRDRLAISGPPFSDFAPLFDVTQDQMNDAQLYYERHIGHRSAPH